MRTSVRLLGVLACAVAFGAEQAQAPPTSAAPPAGVPVTYQLPEAGPLPKTYRVTLAITDAQNPDSDLKKPVGLGQFVRAFGSGGAGGGPVACTDGQMVWAFSTDGSPNFVYWADAKPFGPGRGHVRSGVYNPAGRVTAMACRRNAAAGKTWVYVAQRERYEQPEEGLGPGRRSPTFRVVRVAASAASRRAEDNVQRRGDIQRPQPSVVVEPRRLVQPRDVQQTDGSTPVPGAWAPLEFVGLDGRLVVRNWLVCGPFGGPGAERFRHDLRGKMPGTNQEWKQAAREFCEAAVYPPDEGPVDVTAAFRGAMVQGYWNRVGELRWRPARIAELDSRVICGGAGQVWFGATWVHASDPAELEFRFHEHPQTHLRWFLNGRPRDPAPARGEPVPTAVRRLSLQAGWNEIRFRGYCTGYPPFRAGVTIAGPEPALWKLRLSAAPPAAPKP